MYKLENKIYSKCLIETVKHTKPQVKSVIMHNVIGLHLLLWKYFK